jgi:hypothetical protein
MTGQTAAVDEASVRRLVFWGMGYAGHGLKDLWQERHQYVAGTRWWPPLCAAVDVVVAALLVLLLAAGVSFHR